MSNASTPGTSNQVARFLAPETHQKAVFATTLYAQPYNIDATGFYFHDADDYRTKSEGLRDCYGSPVEEFEIQYIDGDDAQLFEACGINQCNLDQWFDDIETLDDREKVALYYLTADAGCTLDNAMDKIDDVCLYEGRLQEAAEELFDEIYAHDIPESIRCYIDYEKFARDCEMGGDMTEFLFDGTTWTCTNASGI